MNEQLLAVVIAYGAALAEKRQLKAERNGHQCRDFSPSDVMIADPGTPKCYDASDDTAEWCDECKVRNEIHQRMRAAHLRMRSEKRRLDYYAMKAARSPER